MFLPPSPVSELGSALKLLPAPYYVYVLHRPDGTPFYVGKGVGNRCLHHENEARNTSIRSHKLNLIRSLHRAGAALLYAIHSVHECEAEALAQERRLIADLGRHDLGRGPLTNQTDGGEGTSNPSEESRLRRAASLGGEADDPDRRAAIEFFRSIGGLNASVPIKPVGARRLERLTPHTSPRAPKPRMAWALAGAAAAQSVLVQANSHVRRTFFVGQTLMAVENGVARDMLKAGMIELLVDDVRPDELVFVITESGAAACEALLGRAKLLDLGLLEP